MNLLDPEERSALAGEYVLGTLSDADQAVFVMALARDAELRAEVVAWQDRLLDLAPPTLAVEPSAGLWSRIAESLTPRSHVPRQPIRTRPQPVWQRLGFWQGLTAAAALACLALTVSLALHLGGADNAAPHFVAVLQSPDKATVGWLVEAQAGGTVRLLPLAGSEPVPAGSALQFWTKGERDAGPTSLGLVTPGTPVVVPAGKIPGLAERHLFEITLEPAGGSPLNRPTGPILFIGRAVKV
jgi:anti-sigma-K factor RskA